VLRRPVGWLYAIDFGARHVPDIRLEELWNVPREGDRDRHDVYYTVASLKSNSSRDGKNVSELRAFRHDIDCGADKAKKVTTRISGCSMQKR
jgi:hypothetical protein